MKDQFERMLSELDKASVKILSGPREDLVKVLVNETFEFATLTGQADSICRSKAIPTSGVRVLVTSGNANERYTQGLIWLKSNKEAILQALDSDVVNLPVGYKSDGTLATLEIYLLERMKTLTDIATGVSSAVN